MATNGSVVLTHGIRERVLRVLDAYGIGAADRIGVGCSGGPDSAVLAHIAAALGRERRLGAIVLLHVDHQLRAGSAAEAAQVEELATSLGLGVVVARVIVDERRASLERAAREARYLAFERLLAEHQLDWILLAHTASDQAETVLMRVIRGTGVVGAAGIPERRGPYLRPLLGTTRAEIEAYLDAHAIPCIRDPMNHDPAYFRVRVRERWLPALRAENPSLDLALCRLAEAARGEREVLEYAARMLLERAAVLPGPSPAVSPAAAASPVVGPGPALLSIEVLREAPGQVLCRALALAAQAAHGESEHGLGARHLAALEQLVAQPAHGTVSLDLPGLVAVRRYHVLEFVPRGQAPGAAAEPRTAAACPDDAAAGLGEAASGSEPLPDRDAAAESVVDVTGPSPPYLVRAWQPGDRMRPARLRGRSRKLSDLFIDSKVARSERARARVVVRAADGIIEWAEHIGPAFGSHVRVVLTSKGPVASNKVSY